MRPTLLLALLLLLGCRSAPTDAIELRLHPEQGSRYRIWSLSEQKIDGDALHVAQSIGFGATYEVLGIESNGTILMGFRCDSVTYRQESQGGVISYNSADTVSEVPDAAIGYSAIYGTSFTFTIRPDGRVVALQGTDSMRSGVIERLANDGEPLTGFLERTIMGVLSDSSLRESIEGIFAWYPDHPVGVGDSWKRREVLSQNIPMDLDNEYELTSITGGRINLKVEASVTSRSDRPSTDSLHQTIQYDLSGSRTGTMEVDQSNGLLRSSDITQELEGSVGYARGGAGVKVRMTTKTLVINNY